MVTQKVIFSYVVDLYEFLFECLVPSIMVIMLPLNYRIITFIHFAETLTYQRFPAYFENKLPKLPFSRVALNFRKMPALGAKNIPGVIFFAPLPTSWSCYGNQVDIADRGQSRLCGNQEDFLSLDDESCPRNQFLRKPRFTWLFC